MVATRPTGRWPEPGLPANATQRGTVSSRPSQAQRGLAPPPRRTAKPARPPAPKRIAFEEGDTILGHTPKPAPRGQAKTVPKYRATDEPGDFEKPLPHKQDWPGLYPSFELRGPDPKTSDAGQAVAFWLKTHRSEIVDAARRWRIDRRAIAGAIAWEALQNPSSHSARASGPAKVHAWDFPDNPVTPIRRWAISWVDAVELSGRLPRRTLAEREAILATPQGAIEYIGAIMDVAASTAEFHGWDVREQPAILAYAFHARNLVTWNDTVENKQPSDDFQLPRHLMGGWVADHLPYLEQIVGSGFR